MPDGKYTVEDGDEFGESELWWVVKNLKENKLFLLVNTYSHPGVEKEMVFYRKNGFNVKKPVLRRFDTLKDPKEKNDPEWNYLFGMYAIFELE